MRNRHFPLAVIPVAFCLIGALSAHAATDGKVDFVLQTTDAQGGAITQNRSYYVYRPDNLPKDRPAPMVLCMEHDKPAKFFHRKADEAGFVLVSCTIAGNSSGNTVWTNGDPRVGGYEDIDYTTAVIDRVSGVENCKDAFICGLSKGGHMTCAYACERPSKIRAAADVDEFMGLTTNVPTGPVPMIFFHGTNDNAVPYAMVKDTADAWRATNGLMNVTPVTTVESSPRAPGQVTQTTWEGKSPVAFVTIIGGTHTWPTPAIQTGFDITDAMWAFFAPFVTATEAGPRITAGPVTQVQFVGSPATFRVAAVGEGPLNYQWLKNDAKIPGATSSSYTVPVTTDPAAKVQDGPIYRAVVSNRAGTVTSGGATLTFVAAPAGPKISKHPQDQSVIAGKPATFAVIASDPVGMRYQWQKNGMDIVGATDATYTMPAAITADCGATFRVVVGNASVSRTSFPGTLTVTPAPDAPVIVTNPARVQAHPGDASTFSVTVKSATPMSYQWQRGTLTGNYADIRGATAASYTIAAVTLNDHRALFRCIVTNSAGNTASAGEILMVTKAENIPPVITTQP